MTDGQNHKQALEMKKNLESKGKYLSSLGDLELKVALRLAELYREGERDAGVRVEWMAFEGKTVFRVRIRRADQSIEDVT